MNIRLLALYRLQLVFVRLQVLRPATVGVRLRKCQNPAAGGGLLPRGDAAAPPVALRGREGGRLRASRETEDLGSAAGGETWYELQNMKTFSYLFLWSDSQKLSVLFACAY